MWRGRGEQKGAVLGGQDPANAESPGLEGAHLQEQQGSKDTHKQARQQFDEYGVQPEVESGEPMLPFLNHEERGV